MSAKKSNVTHAPTVIIFGNITVNISKKKKNYRFSSEFAFVQNVVFRTYGSTFETSQNVFRDNVKNRHFTANGRETPVRDENGKRYDHDLTTELNQTEYAYDNITSDETNKAHAYQQCILCRLFLSGVRRCRRIMCACTCMCVRRARLEIMTYQTRTYILNYFSRVRPVLRLTVYHVNQIPVRPTGGQGKHNTERLPVFLKNAFITTRTV